MRTWLVSFRESSGTEVALSLIVARVFGFLSVFILVHLLTSEDFGLLTIVLNITSFFIPLLGFGSSQGLLRFGATTKGYASKKALVKYANYYGFLLQLLVDIAMLLFAVFTHYGNTMIIGMAAVMMVRLTGLFFVEQAKAEARANLDNKMYASLELWSNVFIFTISIVGAWIWGIWGYIIANSICPYIIFFLHKFEIGEPDHDIIKKKEFWNYSVPSVLSLLLFVAVTNVDVFFAGYFFEAAGAAFYRVSVLIPLNLIFIAQIYTQTMFPKLCENHRDRAYLQRFFRNYLKIYFPVALVLVFLGFTFSQDILRLFSNEETNDAIVKIAFLQMALAIILRTPLVNLLSAVGLARLNAAIGAITLGWIITATYIWLPTYGINGLAYIMLLSNVISGILLLLAFFWYLRSKKLF